jgi:hypothetical protein
MLSAPNVAVRRFALAWRLSWMIRIGLLVVAFVLVAKYVGGI